MINKVILEGRLTKDIELKKTAGNISTASFTLAVNRKYKEGETDFINCVAWRQTADFLNNYVGKGDMLSVVGRIVTGSYEGQNGRVYTTEVNCEEVNILFKKQLKNASQDSNYIDIQEQNSFKAQTYAEYINPSPVEEPEINDDDLPFY